jgi:hypothetical protein
MKTFTIEEIKALYDLYLNYLEEHNRAMNIYLCSELQIAPKIMLTFIEWLDVYEQGNDELIYY